MNIRRIGAVVGVCAAVALSGCGNLGAPDMQRQSIQSFEFTSPKLRRDNAYAEVTNVLVDRGFDIKQANKEAGLITTEFKKFTSRGESPPFDYYMQIRINLRDTGGVTSVRITPAVREQNRVNSAAMTERELYYYEGNPDFVRAREKNTWATPGNIMFMNVVGDIAAKAGIQVADVKRNVTSQAVSFMFSKD